MSLVEKAPVDSVDHDAEAAQQAEIEAQIAPIVDSASADKTDTVSLKPTDVVESYPLSISAVGSDDIVFNSASDTVPVTPAVAEQVKYLPTVEVVA